MCHFMCLIISRKADEVINVTDFEEEPRRPYEPKRAAKRMDECERFVSFLNPEARGLDKADDWEERIPKYVKIYFILSPSNPIRYYFTMN